MREYFDAVRALYGPSHVSTDAIVAALKDIGLRPVKVPMFSILSPLRPMHLLGIPPHDDNEPCLSCVASTFFLSLDFFLYTLQHNDLDVSRRKHAT
jgi:hypothetical protein